VKEMALSRWIREREIRGKAPTFALFPDVRNLPHPSWPVLYRPPTSQEANHDPNLRRHGGWPVQSAAMTWSGDRLWHKGRWHSREGDGPVALDPGAGNPG